MTRALEIYKTLRADLATDELRALRYSVRAHYEQLIEAQKQSELIAVDLAALLCARLEGLLESAAQLSGEDRSAVVGAARYFTSSDDALRDEASCTGLDDDVEVFNHVVSYLQRDDLVITE